MEPFESVKIIIEQYFMAVLKTFIFISHHSDPSALSDTHTVTLVLSNTIALD